LQRNTTYTAISHDGGQSSSPASVQSNAGARSPDQAG
jgi:hypothetical protein